LGGDDGMSIRDVDHGAYEVSKPSTLKRVARTKALTVWMRTNRYKGERPYVVGRIVSGRRVLLEEFSKVRTAIEWARANPAA
jgi:hypothetical protein